ncbi:inosine/xanthosine triphosphatase [Melghiribacillus thermohalophilus]|uniref:Probable inosine/xanthosine triphosphatase n=1 Tax=Melghiribacillus thermohalophilus TaxID=1324956 RepID=A0A4R3MUU6_9BACI|nr:DUF84 family protein [Melghiribacillus thermohalophilus]TCT19915.1 inosine/xanthosine triphosphatase [Melghiribacillus thermohalophilus]
MKVLVGSNNPAKVNAVQKVFPNEQVEGVKVSSNVSLQPFSDEETLEGAINRARQCAQMDKDVIGIGLEGGVMELEGRLYVCNWGALADEKGNLYTAGGARIALPDEIAKELKRGKELGDIMDEYTKKQNVKHHEGAIGIFTNHLVDRETMFMHVVQLLRGQMEFTLIRTKNGFK